MVLRMRYMEEVTLQIPGLAFDDRRIAINDKSNCLTLHYLVDGRFQPLLLCT